MAGLALAIAGLVLLAGVGGPGSLVVVVLGVAVVALGIGPLFVLGTGLVVGSARPEQAGSVAALSETSNVFGSTLGLAVLGSLGAAVYRHLLVVPAGVPAGPADTARETVAGAAAAAGQLPAGPAADLVAAAHAAFTTGLTVVAGTGALLVVGVAVLVSRALRPAC